MRRIVRWVAASSAVAAWCCFGLLLAITATQALYARRVGRSAPGPAPAAFEVRERPQQIRPNPLRDAVTEPELNSILKSVEPQFDLSRLAERLPVSLLVHATRLWGTEAEFKDIPSPSRPGEPLTGEYLAATLLSNELFAQRSSMLGSSLLVRSPHGIQAVTVLDSINMSEETLPHQGQLLKVMADIGVRSTRPVVADGGHRGTFADVVRDDAARAFNGVELEFLVAGLSRYARSGEPWANRFGQPQSFDDLAGRLMRQPRGGGACMGGHVPYGLVMLLRSAQSVHLIDKSTGAEIRSYLRELSTSLERFQNRDGSWDSSQSKGHDAPFPSLTTDQRVARLSVTGHTLEWIAFAPEDCRPSDDTIRKGVRSLVRNWPEIVKLVQEDWHRYYPATHAARAVWMLSGLNTPSYAAAAVGGE